MRNFSKDIMEYSNPNDLRESEWFEVDEDRGFARRHRVYKRLLFAPAMYRGDGSDEDFEYLKKYGGRLIEELEQMFDCHIHIHRGSAYFLLGDDCKIGDSFPGNNSLADILLLCFGMIRKKIETNDWEILQDETCTVDRIVFEALIKDVKLKYGLGFSKMYRDMPEGEFIKNVINEWVDKKLKNENVITIKGELVKSTGEAVIANFLFKHGIEYKYEEVYSELIDDRKIYKPDFTLDLAGNNWYNFIR